jgi:hypothetical protein
MPFADIAPRLMQDLQRDLGLTAQQAAGIVGNYGHESAGFTAMQEKNPRGGEGGLGWGQWTGPRRQAFLAYCQQNGLNPASYEANYGFTKQELMTTHKDALEAVRGAQTVQDATRAWDQKYEISGVKNFESRDNYAAQALSAGTGSAYPSLTQNANNIPGGYIPSELPAGGLAGPQPTPAQQEAIRIAGWDPSSYANVNPKLLQIVAKAAADNPGLFAMGDKGGRRDLDTQKALLAKGVTKTLKSYHVAGNAMDLWPINPATGKPDVNYLAGYAGIKAAMNKAAADLGVGNLKAGMDWKGSWDKPHWELKGENPYEATAGSTGAAYPQRVGANGIPGGYTPSELPAGGIAGPAGPPGGVLGPEGREPPAPAAPASAAPLAPFFARPDTDAARMLSDPSRYGLSSGDYAELRRQMQAGGPGGGTIGNIPVPAPAPTAPSAPPPAGVLSPRGAEPQAPGAPPPSPHAGGPLAAILGTLAGSGDTGGFQQRPIPPPTGKQPTDEERETTRKYLAGLGPGPIGIWNPEKIWSQRPEYAQPQPNAGEELRRYAEAHPEIRAWEGRNQAPVIGERPQPAPGGQGAATQMLDDWRNKRPLGLFQGGWT